ncbi:ATP-dependent helicase [Candidatus Latescibacterota bacterium]
MLDLDTLNPPQREAVEHTDSPCLILAGAGSGKTRVLTYKIAQLVANGVKPWRILAVTFTNKAAKEMSSRVETLLNIPAQNLWIGTFHGICARILRMEADSWNFRRDFTIYDDDDQNRVIKKVLKNLGVPKETLHPSKLKQIIKKAKNDFLSPDEISNIAYGNDVELITKAYERYLKILSDSGAFDFEDLLLRPVEMFEKYPESREKWQNKFDYILVDEFQDTNKTQYMLLKILTGTAGRITVVGDDDQSIYKWRGANIQNILGFESDFKGVKTFRLEQNYRSTGNILNAAHSVVKNNKGRMAKKLWTSRPDGDKIQVIQCYNDRDEAERVLSSIEREKSEKGLKLKDFVILYRTNAQSRSFEEIFLRRGIKYTIVGGTRFYNRMEIKDILAYLQFINNHDDVVGFTRAITTPKTGIGAKSISAIEEYASDNKISLYDALGKANEIFSGVAAVKVAAFYSILKSTADLREKSGIDRMALNIIDKTHYDKYLEKSDPESAEDRLNNIKELVTALEDFNNTTEEDDLTAFLAEVSLVSAVDKWDDESDVLTLMTLHSAKGLEFPSVYIGGVENGLFPLPSSFEDREELEEERRLFYVGITRAEETLHISYAQSRMRHGSYSGGASIFIDEMPEDIVDTETSGPSKKNRFPRRNQPVKKVMEFEDYPQEFPDYEGDGQYRLGSFVRHPSFGRGKITECTGTGDKTTLTIKFGSKEKKIRPKYVDLVPA